MPEKPGKNREQLKEITDRIEAGIRDIFESGDIDKYRNYLRTMSRFHNYSLNNQALIHLQRPDATLVAGYNRWRDKFSRHVLRGEKGITIIAPTPYKKKIEQEKSINFLTFPKSPLTINLSFLSNQSYKTY